MRKKQLFSLCFALVCLAGTIIFRSVGDAAVQLDGNITKILFIRHGQTDGNIEERVEGSGSDTPVNAVGKEQAYKVAQLLKQRGDKIDALYSSDLKRARETASFIAKAFWLPVILDSLLRERNMGDAEGMLEKDFEARYAPAQAALAQRYPDRWERWHHTPINHAETNAEVLKRIDQFIKNIVRKYRGKTVAAVTHGLVIGILIEHHTGLSEDIRNCSIAEFYYDHTTNSLIFRSITNIDKVT